ncbi:hypothetical protein PS691_04882 [Pseudomonas fluorescens]|uniref:Phage holin family protein n=2 Tax=Pseudomonas fluorescens TaxID=294 RepID=A0A5E7ETP2_PSEFL|nr:hypothetical protein PS691_04882 [Pseudomonas fluorescens]
MGVLMFTLTFTTAISYLLSAFRLACYQRDEKRHCWRGGLLTSLCGVVFCLAGMDVLLTRHPVSLWQAFISVLLCGLIIRCGGNLGLLWRTVKQGRVEPL